MSKTLLLGNTWLFIVIIKWIFLIHIFFFTIVTQQLTLPDVLQYLNISPIVVHIFQIFADYLHVFYMQLPDKAQSGQRILTVKPKENLNKKHKIRNNAQSLLKETTRQKKGNVLSNIWGDHQCKIFWLLISLFSIEVYVLRPVTSDPSKSEVWSKKQSQKEKAEVKTDSSTQ